MVRRGQAVHWRHAHHVHGGNLYPLPIQTHLHGHGVHHPPSDQDRGEKAKPKGHLKEEREAKKKEWEEKRKQKRLLKAQRKIDL